MENVVVGVGNDPGQRAIEWVIRRASQRPVQVTLVRAFDMFASDPMEEEQLLERAGERIAERSPGTVVRLSLVTAATSAALLEAAKEADLLVVGSHHRHPIDSLLTGSVPLHVAARSSCATVIVPDDWAAARHRTVVVGIADDGTSDRAMLFAAREAQAAGAELEALHAWSVAVPTLASPDRVEDEPAQRVGHRAVLTRALDRIRAAYPRVRVRGVLEQRSTATALAERAAQGQLLVLGSHRRGPVTGVILGSTARNALRTTTAPLCIVPPAASLVDVSQEGIASHAHQAR